MEIIHQLDLNKFFSTSYIFETNPASTGLYQYLVFLFALTILVAIFLGFKNRGPKNIYSRLRGKFFNLLLTTGIVGLLLIFFRSQQIVYLGSRLLLILLFLLFLVWLGSIIWYWLVILPKEIKKNQEKENFEKYLPHRRAGLSRKKSRSYRK